MELSQQLTAAGLVLALLMLALAAAQRRGWVRTDLLKVRTTRKCESSLQVLERLPLTPHHTLHLIRAGDRDLLLATHASGVSVVNIVPPEFQEHSSKAAAGGGTG
jgi:flagellar biogenesis protein FliO